MNYQLHEGWQLEDELYSYQLGKMLNADLEKYVQVLFPGGHMYGDNYEFGRYNLRLSHQCSCFGLWIYKTGESANYSYRQTNCKTGKGLISLYAHERGITEKSAMYEIAKKLNLPLEFDSLLCTKFLPFERAERLIEISEKDALTCHPVFAALGYSRPKILAYYRSIDGRCYCVTQIYIHSGKKYSIPLSAWLKSGSKRRTFNHIAPREPYPLFRLSCLEKETSNSVLLLPDEHATYLLSNDFSGMTKGATVTTWPCGNKAMIGDVDWSPIVNRPIMILVEYSVKGYRKARRVYKALMKAGAKTIRFISNKEFHDLPPKHGQDEWDRAMSITLHKTYNEGENLDYNQFLMEANSYVGAGFHCRSNLHAMPLTDFLTILTQDAEWALTGLIHIIYSLLF